MMTITAPDVIAALWRANVALIPMLAIILVVRGPLRRHCGSDAIYWLWPIVPMAMMMAALPPQTLIEHDAWAAVWRMPSQVTDHMRSLIQIWLGGAAVSFVLLACAHVRLLWKARRGKIGPAVIGFIAPRIYLPADFEDRFSPSEQIVIRAHERAHMVRKDTLANGCVALLQILFWFNPAALLAARVFREDQEMACDQTVMDLYPERRRLYAETMLKSQTVHWSPSLGCAWGRHPLEHRIAALGIEPSTRRMVTIRLILVSAAIMLTYQLGEIYFPPWEAPRPVVAQAPLPQMHPTPVKTRHRRHVRAPQIVEPVAAPAEAAPAIGDTDV
jgi:beta-lactamase regulating signal transducer with metallopeptidase domain